MYDWHRFRPSAPLLARLQALPLDRARRAYQMGLSGQHLVGAIGRHTFEQGVRETMSEYRHAVVIEASGPDGLYQRITFEQFYDSGDTQVAEQERLFLSVANAVMETAKQYRDDNVSVQVKR